ncbi:MAG TPA: hypothetical protein VFE32_18365 [Puia sp.]|jgi:hypothetical protein|nr:hypothetical protein [Puia sp.]
MKHAIPILLFLAGLAPKSGLCQLNNGGLYANFGVDADTRTNWMKYGLLTGAVASDDWFAPSGAGHNVIDTSNFATYLALLQAGGNITFNKRMSQPLYAKVGGTLWLDAVYGRDYQAAAQLKDSTTFTIAAKNGDNPANWHGGEANIPTKNDLVDVYAHMRRSGLTVHDSLWLFTAVSTFGTRGSSYFDVELYRNSFTYNASTGAFTTAGASGGHTEWLFDASGNIIQTGDLIIAVDFTPGSVPVVQVCIWISQTTLSTITPAYFNFTGAFNGATSSPTYGYASIVSKAGTTAWGAGISNYSSNATLDTTYSTPWGTGAPSGGADWSAQYLSLQFIEVGLNLTRMGVDPALYSTLSPCQQLFSDIFFKSRSSNSFTSNMQDFVMPLTFTQMPVMDFSATGDTIRCNNPTGTITLTNNTTAGYYTWQEAGGGVIAGSNSDSSQLSVGKPGTYIVSAAPAPGCPATRKDTIVVPVDTFPPVASAFAGLSGNNLALYGGNFAASNYSTPFGGSQGLTYGWSGPDGFTSTLQDPLTDTAWGAYHLTVTENRNGCTDTASTTVLANMFIALLSHDLSLSGADSTGDVSLHWQDANAVSATSYIVERMDANSAFRQIATVDAGGCLCFVDGHPLTGVNDYRIEAVGAGGLAYYSRVVSVTAGSADGFYLAGSPAAMDLVGVVSRDGQGILVVYDATGQTLERRNVWLNKGGNVLPLTSSGKGTPAVRVVGLFVAGKLVFSGKALW